MRINLTSNFLLIFLILECSSSQIKPKNVRTETKKENRKFKAKKEIIEKLNKHFSIYKKMSANFQIKGNMNNKEMYYSGKLYSTIDKSGNRNLTITLKDAIFLSPIFTLKIRGQNLTEIDHLRDKRRKFTLDEYRWIEVFGRVFPFKFFLPILMGFVPNEILSSKAKYSQKNNKLTYLGDYYDSIGNLTKNSSLKSIYFRTRGEKEVVIIQFIGRSTSKKKRYFPHKLHINRSRSTNDFLSMKFSRVNIR